MNEKVTNQLNAYKRTLENKKLQSSIYSILLVTTMLFFDVFGLRSMLKITKRRYDTLQSLNQLVTDLEFKKDNIDMLKQKLDASQYYLNMLEETVPVSPTEEKYMVGLVQTAAKHGYKQNKLIIKENKNNFVELRGTFQGSPDQMEPFIESIENQDRLSVIQTFHYSIVEKTVNLEVVIRIYYLYR